MDSPGLEVLAPTRRAILVALKRTGGATAEELGAGLGITPSAVRQHLQALTAEGLVEHAPDRARAGRPRHRHVLTPAGEAFFPKRYGDLTLELLADAEAEDAGLVDRLFERRRNRRLERTLLRVEGRPLEGRVEELTRVLDEDGYVASCERADDGALRIVEHNCAVLEVARRYGQACSTELEFIRAVLPDAQVERVRHMMAGQSACAYEIRPREREDAPAR
ncbi:MAG: putative transcriptional regulator [Actinomycetia bacterium]|nr:putative transcriptional regulator [Actinomycetes bacterium]